LVKKGEKVSNDNLQFEIQDSLQGTAGSMSNADATIVPQQPGLRRLATNVPPLDEGLAAGFEGQVMRNASEQALPQI
jgi:hypothetical protein